MHSSIRSKDNFHIKEKATHRKMSSFHYTPKKRIFSYRIGLFEAGLTHLFKVAFQMRTTLAGFPTATE